MYNFSLDNYNIYSDKEMVPVYNIEDERSYDVSPILFDRVIKKASLFTKLFSIFL